LTQKTKKPTIVTPNTWANRIVGSGEEAPEQLLANPKNWRIHPKQQQDALEGLLNEVGWIQQTVVNKRTGFMVDGHLRVTLALRRNEPTVPVLYVDLSEDEENKVLAALDPITGLAVMDQEQLRSLLSGIETAQDGLQTLYSDLASLVGESTEKVLSGNEGENTSEVDPEGFELLHHCPRCGFEFESAK
jgi:ParB-like chromosome segregation protein Spo0J